MSAIDDQTSSRVYKLNNYIYYYIMVTFVIIHLNDKVLDQQQFIFYEYKIIAYDVKSYW